MQGFSGLLALIIVWLTSAAITASAADITAASVLAIAKDEAEKAGDEDLRRRLRARVARFMKSTGQEAAFAGYVADTQAHDQSGQSPIENDDARFNIKMMNDAKSAFLRGDHATAIRLLGQCRSTWPPSSCSPGEWWFFSKDTFVEMIFLRWLVEADQPDAALRLLKETAWPPELQQLLLVIMGPHIATSDRGRKQDIQRMLKLSGLRIEACIVDEASVFRNELAPKLPAKPRSLSEAATLRKLACDGEVQAALAKAQAITELGRRITALGIVAEGIEGIPGFDQEWLAF
jgi:hypothetical protein